MTNTLEKVLKNMKVYRATGKVDGWPLFVGHYSTKAEAQKALNEVRKADGRVSFVVEIEEVNLYEIVQTEKQYASSETRHEVYVELKQELEEKYETEYQKEIAREKKRLQKEMRKLLKEWCDIDVDGRPN